MNTGLVGDAMDDLVGGLTESYTLGPSVGVAGSGNRHGSERNLADNELTDGVRAPGDLDDILIKSFDRRSPITARIKA
ncbi:unnamed protein product [Protopolystoma xenopodis]|uniref:Uncharacterized protein n=1 Tax=Protopolystoma xenopodis TaxID=117903 RepID=A0A3S5C3U4_9PLAT|nr:unnamed protein product [Protopolystoma xenopodis]